MPDKTVQAKVFMKPGAKEQVIANGGKQTVESGGKIDMQQGSILIPPTVADADLVSGTPQAYTIDVPDGVTADIDKVLPKKFRVTDVRVIKKAGAGGASDTITVKNAANPITDAIDINVADKVVKRAGTIDDAYYDIAAGGTLRVTRTKSSAANVACQVVVEGVLVA